MYFNTKEAIRLTCESDMEKAVIYAHVNAMKMLLKGISVEQALQYLIDNDKGYKDDNIDRLRSIYRRVSDNVAKSG